jgi:hypothetical protein
MMPYIRLFNGIAIERGVYLSPEALLELSNKISDPDLSLKSDIYSLAMVTLEMCLLEPLDSLYDYNKYQINRNLIT